MGDASLERTLSQYREAHVYTLPPRPNAGGYRCQDWPKSSHVFTGRVRVVASGDVCTIRLEDPSDGKLFAQCPLDNDNPEVTVEPVADSSRYFVLKVQDGSGRHAFLGMGFVERNDAFDFNVTLQDHVKYLRREAEAEAIADAPAAPPVDYTLKGSMQIALPAGHTPKPREAPTAAAGGASLGGFLPPPPGASGGSRRPVAAPAAPAAPAAFAAFPAPAPADASAPADWATFD